MKIVSFIFSFALISPSLFAKDDTKKGTWIDPAKAAKENADFSIQGEYFKKDAAVAAQIVALGKGTFEAYVLEGGLPGLGWKKGDRRTKLEGKLEEGVVTFAESNGVSALYDEKHLTIQHSDHEAVKLPRITRKSPSLEAKAPEGAVVLFNGADVDQWINGKIENGLLKSTGTTSRATFKSYSLHLEFRTPYKPTARGQGRGNSGVYFGGRWETQILDSFGLDGKMNECGGIYSIAEPKVNMCLPPLTWQTYDVEFTAAKFDENGKRIAWPNMTVKLNGVVIHEKQELNKDFTTAAPIIGVLKDEGRPVYLQNHGNPVFFRNIWVLPKK